MGHDEAQARLHRGAQLPQWIIDSHGRYQQFVRYTCSVYSLPHLLGRLSDGRLDPDYKTLEVINSLFHASLLRIPSFNALEGDLKEADFQQLIGRKPRQDVKAFSTEVLNNCLDKLYLDGVREVIEDVIWAAERNKAFREGSYGCLRDVAIDGWESFKSYHRCCDACLERKVYVKNLRRQRMVASG